MCPVTCSVSTTSSGSGNNLSSALFFNMKTVCAVFMCCLHAYILREITDFFTGRTREIVRDYRDTQNPGNRVQ
jgi:hypothetical protein